MYNTLLINVDELWLKGKNRPMYFRALRRHIRGVLETFHGKAFSCVNEHQRFVARSDSAFDGATIGALLKVPGIHSLLPARRVPVDMKHILPCVREDLGAMAAAGTLPATFKVETRRSYKGFPLDSMEVSRTIGAGVLEAFPTLSVKVKGAEMVIEIRILQDNIYIATRNLPGTGGLPVGTSGHLVTLISGGFDSPVASYLMARRGCRQTFVFFYAYPFVGEEVKDKILELVGVLGGYQQKAQLYVVGFGDVQDLIARHCKADYRTVLFRKAMLGCAGLLARKVKGEALLTGDSLGQVSSQTIGNISALDRVSPLSVFRPLLGYNKVEIIGLARKIGTHDISVIPHDDACSLFAPRHPVIRPDFAYIESFDAGGELDQSLRVALEQARVYDIRPDGRVQEKGNPFAAGDGAATGEGKNGGHHEH